MAAQAQRVRWFGGLLGVVLLGAGGGCFSDLQSNTCIDDQECFVGEACVNGTCIVRATVDLDAGMDVEDVADEDAEDVKDEPDLSGTGIITGRVVVAGSGLPVPNATVTTFPSSEQVRTLEDGEYAIAAALNVGQVYTVSAMKSGYELESEATVRFQSSGSRVTDLNMCEAVTEACSDLEGAPYPCEGLPDGTDRLFREERTCDGEDNDCDGRFDEGLTNACGGCATLTSTPNTICGECGQRMCGSDKNSVVCTELSDGAECVVRPGCTGTMVCNGVDPVTCMMPANGCP